MLPGVPWRDIHCPFDLLCNMRHDFLPMARKKSSPSLINRAEADAQRESLIEAVECVAGQLQILRETIDEIREDFQWAIRNDRLRCPRHVVHVTSMALDPLAEDFGARLNRLNPENLHPEQQFSRPPSGELSQQRELWASQEDDGA